MMDIEDDFTDFKIGVAGLGLIGGSLAKAFKRAGFCVAGFDIDKQTIDCARQEGAVDCADTQPDVLFDCDYIFVALYPDAIIDFVKKNAPNFKKGAVVVDCCGIKGHICESLYNSDLEGSFTFIGGHPMAGTEYRGYSASFAELFKGASFILTPRPAESEEVIEKLSALIKTAGFERVVVTTPKHHDRMIAFTSQLPHILACAYVMSPSCPEHSGFSAGSYRDVSRVAHITPELWSQLFIDNKEELCCEIDIMINNMKKLRDAAYAGDKNTLFELLSEARRIKDSVDK
ncbi:prephenate dehydrogenase [[Clostridium] cellulosi]|jgi:Prephenate dehydrogenase.|nr:MAG: prephenate dehydrogenase/arogenate dehydrogenase family protein [[Clostridium] cellulosi]